MSGTNLVSRHLMVKKKKKTWSLLSKNYGRKRSMLNNKTHKNKCHSLLSSMKENRDY